MRQFIQYFILGAADPRTQCSGCIVNTGPQPAPWCTQTAKDGVMLSCPLYVTSVVGAPLVRLSLPDCIVFLSSGLQPTMFQNGDF